MVDVQQNGDCHWYRARDEKWEISKIGVERDSVQSPVRVERQTIIFLFS